MTGPGGFPQERVVEVSVCRMYSDGTDFDTMYDSFVFAEPMDLGKVSLDYLSDNYGITAEMLYVAPPEDIVVRELFDKLRDRECTSFDVNRTFGQFLCVEPWDLNGEVTFLPSISGRIPPEYAGDIKSAYDYVTPGNPMDVHGSTSMDLCLMSTSIMMRLRQSGYFRSEVPEEHAQIHDRVQYGQQEQQQIYYHRPDAEDGGDHARRDYEDVPEYEQQQASDEELVAQHVLAVHIEDPQAQEPEHPRDYSQ